MFKRRGLQNRYFGASLMVMMMRMIVVKMMIMLVALTKPPCLSSKLAVRCAIITIIIATTPQGLSWYHRQPASKGRVLELLYIRAIRRHLFKRGKISKKKIYFR